MFSQNLAVQIVLTCLPRTGSAHSILSYKSLTTGLVIRNFQTVKGSVLLPEENIGIDTENG